MVLCGNHHLAKQNHRLGKKGLSRPLNFVPESSVPQVLPDDKYIYNKVCGNSRDQLFQDHSFGPFIGLSFTIVISRSNNTQPILKW